MSSKPYYDEEISYGFSVDFSSTDDELSRWRQRALFKMYLTYVNHADIRPSWDDFLNFEREMAEAPLDGLGQ